MKRLLFTLEILGYISLIALEVYGCWWVFNKLIE